MNEPTRADLLEADLLEVHAALAVALHVPLDQINPNALPDYIRALARQAGTIPVRDRPSWFSQAFDRRATESDRIAEWLNGLERRPGVDFVGEVIVQGMANGEWVFVLASVFWEEHRP